MRYTLYNEIVHALWSNIPAPVRHFGEISARQVHWFMAYLILLSDPSPLYLGLVIGDEGLKFQQFLAYYRTFRLYFFRTLQGDKRLK